MDEQPGVTSEVGKRERRDASENRQQILAAAKQLFASQGVDNTSMYEIARAAGVGQGTLYRRFAHKGELCEAVIVDDLDAFQEWVGATITREFGPASALARLEILIGGQIRLVESHLPFFAAIKEAEVGSRRPPPHRRPFHIWLRGEVVKLLTEAIAQHEIASVDVEFTADAILAVLSPPVFGHQRRDRGYTPERIAAGMRLLFVDGLRRASDALPRPSEASCS